VASPAIMTVTTAGDPIHGRATFRSSWATPDFTIAHLADFYTWTLQRLAPLNLDTLRTWLCEHPATLPDDEAEAGEAAQADWAFRYTLRLDPDHYSIRFSIYDLAEPNRSTARTPRLVVTDADLYEQAARCCDRVAGPAGPDGGFLPAAAAHHWRQRGDGFRRRMPGSAALAVAANLVATFYSGSLDDPRPRLELAGVTVSVWIDGSGELRVDLQPDGAAAWLRRSGATVATRITVQGIDGRGIPEPTAG
jgi:hypothetical protein